MDDHNEALTVVRQGPSAIPDRFGESIGDLVAFSGGEAEQFDSTLKLIGQYVQQISPKRPLCIGVFGPPGSGKSFTVKQIVKAAESASKVEMPTRTFNLTQIPSPRELSELLGQSIASAKNVVPVLFFDEFDAPLDGSSLGWLSWFLSRCTTVNSCCAER